MKSLKAAGDSEIHFFDPIDECPHRPEAIELWQESWVIYFWDCEQEVFVFLRVSQEPNKSEGGTHTVWLNVWAPGVQYKNVNTELELHEGTISKDGISVGNGLCSYRFDGRHHWQVCDASTSIQLDMTDDHQGAAYYRETAGIIADTLKNHIEAIGTATGKVALDGKTYNVAGPAWRDHSWGKRHWLSVRGHRAFHAIMENDFHFFSLVIVGEDGSFARNALIINGCEVEHIDEFCVTTYVDEDCITNCGGRVEFVYAGESQELEFSPIPRASVQMHNGLACVDTLCHVKMGKYKGVGFSETSHRAQGGDKEPRLLPTSRGRIENGVFKLT